MYALCTALAVAASSSTMVSFICSVFCFLFILDSRQQSEFINQRGEKGGSSKCNIKKIGINFNFMFSFSLDSF
jgi:hypothetical protein